MNDVGTITNNVVFINYNQRFYACKILKLPSEVLTRRDFLISKQRNKSQGKLSKEYANTCKKL